MGLPHIAYTMIHLLWKYYLQLIVYNILCNVNRPLLKGKVLKIFFKSEVYKFVLHNILFIL